MENYVGERRVLLVIPMYILLQEGPRMRVSWIENKGQAGHQSYILYSIRSLWGIHARTQFFL